MSPFTELRRKEQNTVDYNDEVLCIQKGSSGGSIIYKFSEELKYIMKREDARCRMLDDDEKEPKEIKRK
jgi:hypothetical protein